MFSINGPLKQTKKEKKTYKKSNKKNVNLKGSKKEWKNFTLCPARPTPSTSTNTPSDKLFRTFI